MAEDGRLVAWATALAGWLEERIPAASGMRVTGLRAPESGMSSETLLFEAAWDGSGAAETLPLVLRAAPQDEGPFPEYDLALQHRVLRSLARTTAVPVPETLWLEPDDAILGTPFLVMRRVEGWAPSDRPSYHATGPYKEGGLELRRRMWRGVVSELAKLHAADQAASGLQDVPGIRPGEEPERYALAYWRRYLDEWIKDERDERWPVLDSTLEWLERERPEPSRISLVWGDAKLGNVLFDEAGRVTALLDWEMCRIGDPTADLASLYVSDLRAQDEAGARLEGTPEREELIDLYECLGGGVVHDFHYWEVFSAFWRGAVQIKAMKQLRERGVELPERLFVDNFPFRTLRGLLDLADPT